MRVEHVRQSLAATYVHYQMFASGIPVVGTERVERLAELSARQLPVTLAAAPSDRAYVNGRLAVRRIESDAPHQRYARYYDAVTGELLRSDALFFRAAGRVFDPNPVARLNAPELRDQNDSPAAVPAAAYSTVDLPGLPASGPLVGPNVQIVDTDAPFTAHADASQSLLFDRSQPQFEEVNAYFHIDRSLRYLQSLGYTGARRIIGYSLPVDPHAAGGSDASFFAIGDTPGEGQLFFGDGGTDDAEDSDIMLHEFAHAIHEWIAPGALGGPSSGEPRAIAEGFGDYWSFSSNYAGTAASGRDPFCIGDWDARCWTDDSGQRCGYPAGSDCLRRVDSTKTMADFVRIEEPGTEHLNGAIWSSALREIFIALTTRYGVEQGRRIADTLVIEGLFGTTADTTFAIQARKILDADRALNGGANTNAICRAMTTRRILAVGDCGAPPRGDLTVFQSATATLHIDDARAIADVFVHVRLVGAGAAVTLIAPDGTSIRLSSTSPTDATYNLDAVSEQSLATLQGRSAAGDWRLVVENGELRSWSLMIRFAGDAPLSGRPVSIFGVRKHLFAAGHVSGAGGTLWITDLRVFNGSTSTASVTLIFTPSGANGYTEFAAVNLSIAPRQLVVLDDVVRATLQTRGLGQLEIRGDTDRVIVNSRTYTSVGDATYGELIPAFDTTAAGGDEIVPLQNSSAFRSNVGIAEVAGSAGVVRFTFFDAAGATVGSTDVPIAPFGHAQIPVPVAGVNLRAEVSIVSGAPLVFAYGSVIDNRSGDAMTIPAERLPKPEEVLAVPAIHGPGVGETNWRTDVWRLTPSRVIEVMPDAGTGLQALFIDSEGAIVNSRTYTTTAAGTVGEFVPALHPPTGAPQEIIGVEESPSFRTNIGVVNFNLENVSATVVVYDDAGNELARVALDVPPRSLQQLPLATILTGPLIDGRVQVRGRVAAYGSVVDNRSQDPSFIVGQY